jgi:Lysylphosphatidylglycerol synthase TM region
MPLNRAMTLPKLTGSTSVGLEPAVPARRGVWAKLWPWLLSLVILAFLFTRIPRKALLTAIETGPWPLLGVYAFFQVVLALCADAYATWVSLAITGFKQRFSQIVLARGATYILGILNYAFGQGAFGLYLQRSGVAALRAAGTVLFLIIVNLGVLLFVASFGFLAGGYPGSENFDLSPLGYGLLGAVAVYLASISLRPRFLRRYQLLAPLLEAGLWGHLWAAGGRLPQVLLQVITYWGALRLWGIPVPLVEGAAFVPVVLLIGGLPITPAGLGTTQAALVLAFSPYVPLPTPGLRAAAMLAFSLIYYLFGIASQALIGLCCLQKLRRT